MAIFRFARGGVIEPGPVEAIDGTCARIVDGRLEIVPHLAQSIYFADGMWADSIFRLRREGVDCSRFLSDPHDMDPPTPATAGGARTGGKILDQLRRAVDSRLPDADPVAVSLSGGVDSAAVAALVRDLGRAVRCYTLVDDHAESDGELARARLMAAHLGAEHVLVRVTTDEMIANLRRAVLLSESAIFDGKGVGSICFLERIPEEVLLVGTGADEAFAGDAASLPAALDVESRPAARLGLEVRLPFLDLLGGPPSPDKRVLRDALAGLVPDEIRLRPKTRRWAPPDARWPADLRAASRRILEEALT